MIRAKLLRDFTATMQRLEPAAVTMPAEPEGNTAAERIEPSAPEGDIATPEALDIYVIRYNSLNVWYYWNTDKKRFEREEHLTVKHHSCTLLDWIEVAQLHPDKYCKFHPFRTYNGRFWWREYMMSIDEKFYDLMQSIWISQTRA